jgi:hypothetical protein
METQIMTIRDSLINGFAAGFSKLALFLPNLLGAVLILALGWALSRLVARGVERLLAVARFEAAVGRSGVNRYLEQAFGAGVGANRLMGAMAKWFVRLIFIQAAANLLSMPQVTAILNSILGFLPNLFVAIVILAAGVMLAQAVGKIVLASVLRAGFARAGVFPAIAKYAIIGFATIAAVSQIGVATALINILFTGLVASLALAIGLAFGLGGRGVAEELTRNLYERGRVGTETQLRAVSGGKSHGDLPGAHG